LEGAQLRIFGHGGLQILVDSCRWAEWAIRVALCSPRGLADAMLWPRSANRPADGGLAAPQAEAAEVGAELEKLGDVAADSGGEEFGGWLGCRWRLLVLGRA